MALQSFLLVPYGEQATSMQNFSSVRHRLGRLIAKNSRILP